MLANLGDPTVADHEDEDVVVFIGRTASGRRGQLHLHEDVIGGGGTDRRLEVEGAFGVETDAAAHALENGGLSHPGAGHRRALRRSPDDIVGQEGADLRVAALDHVEVAVDEGKIGVWGGAVGSGFGHAITIASRNRGPVPP